MDKRSLVEVFVGDEMTARLVLGYLDCAGIQAEIIGEVISTVAPHHAAPGGAGTVQVLVWSEDLEKARAVIGENGDSGTT